MTDRKTKSPFYLIDTGSEFYRPVTTRVIICIVAALWLAIELANGDGFWLVISGATLAYCIYTLFIAYKPPQPPASTPVTEADEPEEAEPATAEETKKD